MCSWKCAKPNNVSSKEPALTLNAAPASSASRSETSATSSPFASFKRRYCLLSTAGLLKAESSTKISVFDDGAVVSVVAVKAIAKAQERREGYNFDIRKQLIRYDDVLNDQRQAYADMRAELLDSEDLTEKLDDEDYAATQASICKVMAQLNLKKKRRG